MRAHLKLPSMPDTSKARTIMRVRRKGTRSGNFSRFMLASKQSPKSMCSSLPEYLHKQLALSSCCCCHKHSCTIDCGTVVKEQQQKVDLLSVLTC